jgi:hypothetical protein
MVDVQMRAENVRDVLERKTGGAKVVEPRLLGKIHRRGKALVLAGAGVDQHRVLGRAHDERLIGDNHAAGRRIEDNRIQRRKMPLADLRIVRRKHVLRLPPRSIALDDAGDGDVTDLEGLHLIRPPRLFDFCFAGA